MPRRALAALGALALAARLSAQETAPDATAAPPESFELDRAGGPFAFDVRFQLADKDPARLQVRFDEVDEPAGNGGAKGDGEHEILGLDFQPFEGARFVLSRSTRSQSLVSSALLQVPEPKGLEFQLHFELPQEGGLSVTLPDGMPVVVATTPRARRMKVEFAASGGVLAFTATKPERSTQLAVDPAGEAALAALVRHFPFDPIPPPPHEGLGGMFMEGIPNAPAVKEVRAVDRQEVEGGVVERYVVAFEEGIESPLVVARPAADVKRPALLCVAGGPKGNADERALRALTSGFAAGRTVACFELIGVGERRLVLPHDALCVHELELVGLSSFDGAAVEARQILKWLSARADVDPARVAVTGTGAGATVASRIALFDHSHPFEEPAASGPLLAEEAVHVGDDYLHLRFDSCQLNRARERREELPPPDRTVALGERMGGVVRDMPSAPPLVPLVFARGEVPVEWRDDLALRKHVTIVGSDRGVRVALEEWAARHPASEDETCLAIDPVALELLESPWKGVDPRLAPFLQKLAQIRGDGAEPPRVFADGATALPLLDVIVRLKLPITSFTASHAIASFDRLLARPHEAHRAEPELGVLTQGMPEWAFVPNALTRWEIEDAVLELIGRGVAVDWQDPVDALRRPLSRHDRLAMWPRVRHAKFAR